MKDVFSTLRVYPGKWVVVDERNFSQEEKEMVSDAYVVEGEFSLAGCFELKGGGKSFIPVSVNSQLELHDSINMDEVKLLTLRRDGEEILRIE